MKFVEWCKSNGYENVLDCFIGDINDIDDLMKNEQIIFTQTNESYSLIDTSKLKMWKDRKIDSITEDDEGEVNKLYWFKCERCNDIHKLTLKEAKSRIQNATDKIFLCKRCQLFENSRSKTTLDSWLNQHKEIELVGRVGGGLMCVIKIKAECISSNSNIKVMIKYNERTSILEVKGLIKGNAINSFQSITFKDWCLIFYRYSFLSYLRYEEEINNVRKRYKYERYYTGKQVINHYDTENKTTAKSIKLGKDRENKDPYEVGIYFYNLPCSSTKEANFLCNNYCKNNLESKVFKAKIKNITDGVMWCDCDSIKKDCEQCSNDAKKIAEDALSNKIDLNNFLRENCTKEEIEVVLKELEQKNKIFKDINLTSTTIENLANEIISSNMEAFKVIKNAYKKNEKRLSPKSLENIEKVNIEKVRSEFIKELMELLDTNVELQRKLTLSEKTNKDNEENNENKEDMIYIVVGKSVNTSEYDFLIRLDKITKAALNKGILYGRPIILKEDIPETEGERFKSVDNKIYPVIGNENLKVLLRKYTVTKITENNWNNLFNGFAGPFKNKRFTTLEIPDEVEKIKPGCFKDCNADQVTFPKHIKGQLKYKYEESKNDKGKCIISGTCNNDVASRKQPQTQGTNFIQYNDVFKMSEALRVYEDHLTLYRGEEAGHGFREYEYIDNFEYQKFYGDDPDDLVLSLLLALNEKVIVSEVTDALIDIYNEMNN